MVPILLTLLVAVAAAGDLTVPANSQWMDSGIAVQPGDLVQIEASGSLQLPQAQPSGPNGLPRGWKDVIRALPVNDAGRGALIGRVGNSPAARPFLIGEKKQITAPVAGTLFLSANLSGETGEGSFMVRVSVTKGKAQEFRGELPPFTQEQLDSIPLRVAGKDGTPGDRTNFILIGSEERVKNALQLGGWVIVDRSVEETFVKGLMVTLNRGAYVTIPMSELYLFERPQDYGYAQADPLRVVAARHHFRIWKAPFQSGGQTVWIGAGTEDIGFDRDQRNGKLTHKIDPEVDKERDYIGESLKQSGLTVKTAYMTPRNPITKAATAHGAEFVSDGRTLLIWLLP